MPAQRIEFDRPDRALPAQFEPAHPEPPINEIEPDAPILPREHPPWMRDAVALSAHSRSCLARSRPLMMRALGFWDHEVRSIDVAGCRVNVDPAGCYRID